jgi:negative regulator of sigma E activity
MLLRRDQLDGRGKLVRRFAFVKLSAPRASASSVDDLPKVNATASANTPHAIKEMPDDLDAPKHLGKGFKLSGVYSQSDGSVQLYYSDGLLGLSVFERSGALAWDELPDGGRTIQLGDEQARVYATSAGTAAVWDADDVTYTAVTDAPLDEVRAIADDFSNGDDSSTLEDIGEFVTAPFTWG